MNDKIKEIIIRQIDGKEKYLDALMIIAKEIAINDEKSRFYDVIRQAVFENCLQTKAFLEIRDDVKRQILVLISDLDDMEDGKYIKERLENNKINLLCLNYIYLKYKDALMNLEAPYLIMGGIVEAIKVAEKKNEIVIRYNADIIFYTAISEIIN